MVNQPHRTSLQVQPQSSDLEKGEGDDGTRIDHAPDSASAQADVDRDAGRGADPRSVVFLQRRLDSEREKLSRFEAKVLAGRRSSEAATPGGLTGYDSAVLSGVRRRPNHRADRRRVAAYDREAAASMEVVRQERVVEGLERQLERAKRDEAAPCDLAAIKPGWLVRDRYGWHRVVRASKKSVTVETAYSWTERIDRGKIVETRAPAEV